MSFKYVTSYLNSRNTPFASIPSSKPPALKIDWTCKYLSRVFYVKKINQKIAFVFLIYTSGSDVLQSKNYIDLEIVQLQIDIYHGIHLIIKLSHAPWLFYCER